MDMEYLIFDALLGAMLNTKLHSVKMIITAPGKLDFCAKERLWVQA
jgi:hypothetical protein